MATGIEGATTSYPPGPSSTATQYDIIDGLVRAGVTVGSVNGCLIAAGLATVKDHEEIMAILANPTGPDVPQPPVNTQTPAITGTAQVGQTLTCAPGTWNGAPTISYRWRANQTNIASNATNSTYVPISAQVGKTLDCNVTATNADGSATATAPAVGPVVA